MNDFEQMVISKLEDLDRKIEAIRSEFTISQITYFENLSPDAVVGTDYVAYRFNISKNAVVRGRFETDRIPRIRKSPIAFIKRNVDAVWHQLNETVEEKAAKLRHKANRKI